MTRHDKLHTLAIAEHIMCLYFDWYKRYKPRQYWRFAFHDYLPLIDIQEANMPRSKKAQNDTPKSTGKAIVTETAWVNVRLSPEQVQEVLHLSENTDELGKALASLLLSGYGFSVRSNQDRANFSAFITGIPSGDDSKLYAISGFGPTALAAAASVVVKYDAILADSSLLNAAQSGLGIG